MDLRRGIYLGAALVLGCFLSTAVSFWETRNLSPQAAQFASTDETAPAATSIELPALRQVEYVSQALAPSSGRPDSSPAIDDRQVVPASYQELEPAVTTMTPSVSGPATESQPRAAVEPQPAESEPAAVIQAEPPVPQPAAPQPAAPQPAAPQPAAPQPAQRSAVDRPAIPGPVRPAMAQAEERHSATPATALAAAAVEAKAAAQAKADVSGKAATTQSAAADKPAAASEGLQLSADGLPWHDNYRLAMDAAVEQQRMMLIYFFDPKGSNRQTAFERDSLSDPVIRKQLTQDYVICKLPTGTAITSSGERIELLKHAAFFEMRGQAGVAILDLAHPKAEYFGSVVSTFPLMSGKYYSGPKLAAVLSLPEGTLTQRTMIYAVRVHPEAPASTQGQFNGVLADEATRHSQHQANILVQGHHNWDSRFHRINTRLSKPVLAEEVVAESWPSENLVDACIDCVDSWRHSPGHWQAVHSRHRMFGFDIRRGRNGIWYATGIFSQH